MGSVLGCGVLALLIAGSGAGARHLETTIQDDAVLLHRSDAQVRQAARQMAELGVDRVRITAGWSALAPAPRSRRRPGGRFDATDSRTYPQDGWRRLDRAVRSARGAGLQVMLDVAFWAPRWAVARPSPQRERHRYAPDPDEFGRFAKAVAGRYPSVTTYTTWNEPNHQSFLQPQWKGDRPFSPHLYRAMHDAAFAAIKSVRPRAQVLIGGTTSIGSPEPGRGHVPPVDFLRALACVDRFDRPLRVPECASFKPLEADGWAHHPYSRYTAPGTSSPNHGDAPIADLGRLTRVLEQLHALGRTTTRWPLYLTEYGYESRPPDPTGHFSPEQQAAYLGWASFLAYRNPEVRMMAQFLLRDIDADDSGFPPGHPRRWRDWQSGLLFADGRPKPAAQAFKIPLHAQYARSLDGPVTFLWGGVRTGRGRKVVRVERRDPETGAWGPISTRGGARCDERTGEFLTDEQGWFVAVSPWVGGGRYRIGWNHGGAWEYGGVVEVSDEHPLPAGPP